MKKTVLLLASMAATVLVACVTAALSALPVAGQTAAVTLVGAGDINQLLPEQRQRHGEAAG